MARPATWCAPCSLTARSASPGAARCATWPWRSQPQRFPDVQLVQIIGGLGQPEAEVHATELCRSVSRSLGCRLTLLPVPGIVADQRTRQALLSDVHVQRAVEACAHLDLAVVGVGAPTPDSVTMRDGSIISQAELDDLLRQGRGGRHRPALLRCRGTLRRIRDQRPHHRHHARAAQAGAQGGGGVRWPAEGAGHPRRPAWRAHRRAGDGLRDGRASSWRLPMDDAPDRGAGRPA